MGLGTSSSLLLGRKTALGILATELPSRLVLEAHNLGKAMDTDDGLRTMPSTSGLEACTQPEQLSMCRGLHHGPRIVDVKSLLHSLHTTLLFSTRATQSGFDFRRKSVFRAVNPDHIGAAITPRLRAELGEFGFDDFQETSQGFRAVRPIPTDDPAS